MGCVVYLVLCHHDRVYPVKNRTPFPKVLPLAWWSALESILGDPRHWPLHTQPLWRRLIMRQ